MLLDKQYSQLFYVDELIQKKRTGSPDQLAQKLGVSRRSVFRIIDFLKNLGAPIAYCRIEARYYYTDIFDLQGELSQIHFWFS